MTATLEMPAMTLTSSDWIAIYVGLAGVLSTLASAGLGKYGWEIFKPRFWKPKCISVDGTFEPLVVFRGREIIKIDSSQTSNQKLELGHISIRGSDIRIDGRYTATYDGTLMVDGKFFGNGLLRNGLAYVIYEIFDEGRSQHTFGTMLLYVQEWGDIFGYFSCKSVRIPGTTGTGFVNFKRRQIL